jgi:hypothetical protein
MTRASETRAAGTIHLRMTARGADASGSVKRPSATLRGAMRGLSVLIPIAAMLAGCSDFRGAAVASPDGGGGDAGGRDGSAGADGAVRNTDASPDGSPPGPTGPGRWGALPSGYCCNSNEECRYRNCAFIGTTRMCTDECRGDSACEGHLPNFACVGATQFQPGRCEPKETSTKCTPQDQFTRGTKPLGACCTATHDGAAGLECEGGHCGAFGATSNPYICLNTCSKPADCPGNFTCLNVGGRGICGPLADPYTCQ